MSNEATKFGSVGMERGRQSRKDSTASVSLDRHLQSLLADPGALKKRSYLLIVPLLIAFYHWIKYSIIRTLLVPTFKPHYNLQGET